MTERRPGTSRPAVDDEDTLIRSGSDFYGTDGPPSTQQAAGDAAAAGGKPAGASAAGPSNGGPAKGAPARSGGNRKAQNAAAKSAPAKGGPGKGAGKPSASAPAASPLSRDREEQPASPVRPRATAQPAAAGNSQPDAKATGRSAATESGGRPTLAERIMNRMPPPPETLRAEEAKKAEAKAYAERTSVREDERPTRPQPKVRDERAESSASQQRSRAGVAAAAGAAGAAAGAAAAGSPRSSAAAGRTSAPRQDSATRAEPAARTETPRESLSVGGGRGPRRTRRARLRLARVDPWSVMKTFFLFSMAGGIVACVAVGVIWTVIESSGLFAVIDGMVSTIFTSPGDTTPFSIAEYLNWQRVMAFTALLACIDIVIFTALATLGAFLYNLSATMLGGLEVTLAED